MPPTTDPAIPVTLTAYADRWTVRPGQSIELKVSTPAVEYDLDFVRLIQGDATEDGPGFKEVAVDLPGAGRHSGGIQALATGSFIRVAHAPDLEGAEGLTIAAWVWPTAPAERRQGVIAKRNSTGPGWWLGIDEMACLTFEATSEDGSVAQIVDDVLDSSWTFVALSIDFVGGLATLLRLSPDGRHKAWREVPWASQRLPYGAADLVIAASTADTAGREPLGRGHFDGRIESPVIAPRALSRAELEVIARRAPSDQLPGVSGAAWDFSVWSPSDRAVDVGRGGHHGQVVNCPSRAVRGHTWSGRLSGPIDDRTAYGAIHFHADDLEDAGWKSATITAIPPGIRSAVYAARLSANGATEYVPFVVAPPLGSRGGDALVVLPTLTYLAYGNEHFHDVAGLDWSNASGHPLELSRHDAYVASHPELAPSLYDLHSDGTVNTYASRLRPIVNFAPGLTSYWNGAARHFAADLYLVNWLEHENISHDVMTDEELHTDGVAALRDYRVVLLGTHPEYYTFEMLEAVAGYVREGGRLMYLGGNGLYWVTSFDPDRQHIIEVRKPDATGTWPQLSVAPGERHHSTTGELGGPWRERGLPPHEILGVGFAGQNFFMGRPYFRTVDSFQPHVAFIFDGVGSDEPIGNFGPRGGAGGDEFDQVNRALGSPPGTLILASASLAGDPHTVSLASGYASDDHQARMASSDLAYYETSGGGAVFAAGSMSWCPALHYNGYQNNVARITGNVLRRFLTSAT